MSHLLILGAGEDQLAAYREASARGLRTIGVDMRADAPGAVLADVFVHVTTRDAAAIAAAVGDLPVAGVIAPAGDAAQPTVRALALHLGLEPIVSEAAARCSSDKGAFRRVLAAAGLPTYRSEQLPADADVRAAAERVGFPAVVKPSDSSGSKGVSIVAGGAAVGAAVDEARRFSVSGEVIVEEYVDGRHLAVESFLQGGDLALSVVSERTTTGPPGMVTITHRAPALLSPAELDGVRSSVTEVARAVDVADGPLNVDVILAADGTPYLVEMGSRLGGNGMPQLAWLVHGVDTVAAAVSHACGETFDVRPSFTRAAILHILHADRGGRLRRLLGLDAIARSRHVVAHELFVAPGDEVHPYVKAANKLGYVLMAGPSLDVLDDGLLHIVEAFGVEVEDEVEVEATTAPLAPSHSSAPTEIGAVP